MPELTAQGTVQRLGRGNINNVIPLSSELVMVCATGGAALFNLSGEALWEIDCLAQFSAMSPDGTLLALVRRQDIYLWDLLTGKLLRHLQGINVDVEGVTFSPDSKLLALWGTPVQLWDVASGQQLHLLQEHTDVERSAIVFSPDSKLLASSGLHRTVQLWDVASGQQLHLLQGHTDKVTSIAFSPDGKLLASGSNDKTVRLWHVASGQQLHLLQEHTDKVTSLAFSPDGKLLASGSNDRTVRLWDIASGQRVQSLEHI